MKTRPELAHLQNNYLYARMVYYQQKEMPNAFQFWHFRLDVDSWHCPLKVVIRCSNVDLYCI